MAARRERGGNGRIIACIQEEENCEREAGKQGKKGKFRTTFGARGAILAAVREIGVGKAVERARRVARVFVFSCADTERDLNT